MELLLEDQEGAGVGGRGRVPQERHHKLRGGNHVDYSCQVPIHIPRSFSVYGGRGNGVCGISCDTQARTERGADIFNAGDIARGAGTIRGEFAGKDNVSHVRRNRRRAGIVACDGTILIGLGACGSPNPNETQESGKMKNASLELTR
jgi:hypothetical protein